MTPRTCNLPRNIRPSWLSAQIDGRASKLAAGPKGRKGRLAASIAIRKDGDIIDDYVEVEALPDAAGETTLVRVTVCGKVVHEERVQQ